MQALEEVKPGQKQSEKIKARHFSTLCTNTLEKHTKIKVFVSSLQLIN